MVLITVAAAVAYKQMPDAWAILGIAPIIASVAVLNLSRSAVH